MKLYIYDESTLDYILVTRKYLFAGFITLLIGFSFGAIYFKNQVKKQIDPEELVILLNTNTNKRISNEKVLEYIRQLNIKFPDIVYAQSILESGKYRSALTKSNNNIFGMKHPTQRPTLSKGEENGYAYFDTWKDCILDYAIYQSRYLNEIKTKEQYFEYLQKSYAEDQNYILKIKQILKTIP